MNAEKIKDLESRIFEAEGHWKEAKQKSQQANRDFAIASNSLKQLQEQMKKARMRSEELDVSDHALIRYLERIHGFDAVLAREVLRARVQNLAKTLGDGKYPFGKYWIVVKDNIIVTIY